MPIKNETKEEPRSPWLSYVNVDDNDIFGYGNDADLGVKSDDDWRSDRSETLGPEKPHWLKAESSVTGPTPTTRDLVSEAHVSYKADVHVEDKLEDVFIKSDADEQDGENRGDKGKNKELWSVNEDLGNLCLGEEILGVPCSTSPLSDTSLGLGMPQNLLDSGLLRQCGLDVSKEELRIATEKMLAKEKRAAKEKQVAKEEPVAKWEYEHAVGNSFGLSGIPSSLFPPGFGPMGSMQQAELRDSAERLNLAMHTEASEAEAMYRVQGISPMLLQVQHQNHYLWEASPPVPTTTEETEYWAAQTAGYLPMVAHQAQFVLPVNAEIMRTFSPVMTESGNQTALPQRQSVSASQPQMKTKETAQLLPTVPMMQMVPMVQMVPTMPMVPMVASPFHPGHEAWNKETLDYQMEARLVSSTAAACPLVQRTQLPAFKSSDGESSNGNSGKAGSTIQTGASSASPAKSPIYRTRRVTRRQQQQKSGSLEKNAEMAFSGESSHQHYEGEPWASLLPLQTAVAMDAIAAGLPSHETALSSSPDSLLSEASQMALQSQIEERMRKDNFLLEQKRAGLTYKQIRRLGGFHEAESTLRGRNRTLTKPKEERVRKPAWTEMDDHLLRRAVRKLSRGRDSAKAKISWKAVADYIYDCGGSYHFGNTTCRKRWDSLVARN